MTELNVVHAGVAFLGGGFSFLSPCVLPLVPGYLSLMSGVSIEKLKQGESQAARAVALNAVIFILGFSVVFTAMGASASVVGAFLNQYRSVLLKIAGAIIILFGVFLLGLLKVPALYRDQRYHGGVGRGKLGTFLLGFSFAFGWTPCIGPILGALLALAATKDTVGQGVGLLAIYSLGLLVFTNQLTWLSSYFAFLNRFSPEGALAGSVEKLPSAAGQLGADEAQAAPDPVLQRADGRAFRLSELRGQVVVVNFWATWCLPCRLEIPHFNRTYQQYRGRGVVFVGVSVDDGGWKDIEAFLKETPIEYPVALDAEKKASEAFEATIGLPITVFIDRAGRVRHKHIGITDVDALRANLEALL